MKQTLGTLVFFFCCYGYPQDFNLANYNNPTQFNPGNRLKSALTKLLGSHYQSHQSGFSNLSYMRTSRDVYSRYKNMNMRLWSGNQYGIGINQSNDFKRVTSNLHFNRVIPRFKQDSTYKYFLTAKYTWGTNLYLQHNTENSTFKLKQDIGLNWNTKDIQIGFVWTSLYDLKPTFNFIGKVIIPLSYNLSIYPFVLLDIAEGQNNYYLGTRILFGDNIRAKNKLSLFPLISCNNFQTSLELINGRYHEIYSIRIISKLNYKEENYWGASFVYYISHSSVCFGTSRFWH